MSDYKVRFLNHKNGLDKSFRKIFIDDFSNRREIMARMPDYDKYIEKKTKLKARQDAPVQFLPMSVEPVLTWAQQRHLFRQYNFLKYRIVEVTDSNTIQSVRKRTVEQIERYIQAASKVKQVIVGANCRLAFNIARQKQYSDFETALSDGYYGLLYAVDKFDYTRDFKFSTYAYYVIVDVIRKNAYSHRVSQSLLIGDDEVLDVNNSFEEVVALEEKESQQQLADMLDAISPREREIIRSYYGLDGGDGMTLDEISSNLKISKERVRQLKVRGIELIKRRKYETEANKRFCFS